MDRSACRTAFLDFLEEQNAIMDEHAEREAFTIRVGNSQIRDSRLLGVCVGGHNVKVAAAETKARRRAREPNPLEIKNRKRKRKEKC